MNLEFVKKGEQSELYLDKDTNMAYLVLSDDWRFDESLNLRFKGKGRISTSIAHRWADNIECWCINDDNPGLVYTAYRPLSKSDVEELARRDIDTNRTIKQVYLKMLPEPIMVVSYNANSIKLEEPLVTVREKDLTEELEVFVKEAEIKNISAKLLARVAIDAAAKMYRIASGYANSQGYILARAGFSFGWDEASRSVLLGNQILTPDFAEYWKKKDYVAGAAQFSVECQPIISEIKKQHAVGAAGINIPGEVVSQSAKLYEELLDDLFFSEDE